MYKKTEALLNFIEASPSCYHVIHNMRKRLFSEGFQELKESSAWKLEMGKGYFVTRNSSSMIAFRLPEKAGRGYQIMASHSDSPAFKVKENPQIEVEKQYVKLNVEKYGGMICSAWMDRPLSVAGRILVEEDGGT